MKFSSHIGKGAWALASRGLPMVYFVVLVLMSRVLSKEQLGTFTVFSVLFNTIFMFSDNFALQAIVKYGVEPDVDLTSLITSTGALFIGFLGIAALALVGAPQFWGNLLSSPHLPSLMPLLALLILVTIPRTLISKVLQMRFHVREIFFVDLANFGLMTVLLGWQLSQGRVKTAADVIMIMIVAGAVSSLTALIMARGSMVYRLEWSSPMTRKIVDFGKYQSGTGIASVLVQNLDTFLVSHFAGPEAVAVYAVAKQQMYKGYDVIRDTQTIFIFPASSKYYSRGEIGTVKTMLEKAVSFLYLLIIPLTVLLVIFAPQILHLVYGGKYDDAAPIFRVLAIGALVLPLQMVFSTSLVGFGKMKVFFRVMSLSFVVNILAALILLPLIGIIGAAVAFVLGLVAQTIQFYFIITKEIPLSKRDLFLRGIRDGAAYLKMKFGTKPTTTTEI